MKLCIDCKYWEDRGDGKDDICTHDAAKRGGVRSFKYYTCAAMRVGICGDDRYFSLRPWEPSHE